MLLTSQSLKTVRGLKKLEELSEGVLSQSLKQNGELRATRINRFILQKHEGSLLSFTFSGNRTLVTDSEQRFLARYEPARNFHVLCLFECESVGFGLGLLQGIPSFVRQSPIHVTTGKKSWAWQKVWFLSTFQHAREANLALHYCSLEYGLPVLMPGFYRDDLALKDWQELMTRFPKRTIKEFTKEFDISTETDCILVQPGYDKMLFALQLRDAENTRYESIRLLISQSMARFFPSQLIQRANVDYYCFRTIFRSPEQVKAFVKEHFAPDSCCLITRWVKMGHLYMDMPARRLRLGIRVPGYSGAHPVELICQDKREQKSSGKTLLELVPELDSLLFVNQVGVYFPGLNLENKN
jgi:hypothetical protein